MCDKLEKKNEILEVFFFSNPFCPFLLGLSPRTTYFSCFFVGEKELNFSKLIAQVEIVFYAKEFMSGDSALLSWRLFLCSKFYVPTSIYLQEYITTGLYAQSACRCIRAWIDLA